MGVPVGVGGGAIGLLVLVVSLLLTGNVPGGVGGGETEQPAPDSDLEQFVGFVVDDVQDTWEQVFARSGRRYQRTKLVLFSGATQSGCGLASSETGPFYCPRDEKVYLDLGFFRELRSRFGAPGDFAQAYVIAHEFGHHVQHLLGIDARVRTREDGIRLELQADCFAGVWGANARDERLLDPGDVDEGLRAAASVGDDRIQRQTQGRVDPETWTHGSAEQRSSWFRRGFQRGTPAACDTFSG